MSDEKKPREWALYIHGETHRGYIVCDPLTDKIPFPPGVETVKVIEYNAFEEAVRDANECRQYWAKRSAEMEDELTRLRAEIEEHARVDYWAERCKSAEKELIVARNQLSITNSNWPHEKKAIEALNIERAKSAKLVEALEKIAKEFCPYGDHETAKKALAEYKG